MLSLAHIVIIFVVALIVFGPEKLPELARNLGKVMSEFKRATNDLRSGFEEQLQQLDREVRASEVRKRQPPVSENDSASPQAFAPALPPAESGATSEVSGHPVEEGGGDPSAEPKSDSEETLPEKALHGDTKPA